MADLHIHTLAVRSHRVSCNYPVFVQHGMGHDAISLDLDAEWDGLSARLVLGPCGSAYDVLYEGEPVVVPAATLAEAGWLPVSVVGHGSDGTVRVTTERCDHLLRVVESGCVDGSVPPEDQPDLLGQLVEAAERADASADAADRATAEATGAASAATEAAGKVDAAVESATKAAQSATDAAAAATDAAKSATDAAERADKLSEDIPGYVTAAQQAATEAERAASEADGAATAAGKSASAAAGSAEQAAGSAGAAQGSAESASGSAQQAATSAGEAAGSATAASESATEAKSSAFAAAQSATDAKASADLAAGWVPADGEPGQLLSKTEDGTAWVDPPSTGNVLTGEASGLVAHGEDAYAQKPIEVRVKGKTWVNRWPEFDETTTINGVTLTCNETGLFTLSGTATSLTIFSKPVTGLAAGKQVSLSKSGGTGFTAYLTVGSKTQNTAVSVSTSYTATGTIASDATAFNAHIRVDSGITVNASFRVMLVEGSEAPDCFTPPASITSVQTGNLVTSGKNLISFGPDTPRKTSNENINDGDILVGVATSGYVDSQQITELEVSDGSVTFTSISSGYGVGFVRYLPKGTAFTVSGEVTGNGRVTFTYISDDKIVVSRNSYGGTDITTTGKVPSDCVGIVVVIRNKSTEKPYNFTAIPQLELGSTATAYEPPNVTTTPLPEVELRSLPIGTCDELVIGADGTCEVERQIYHELFDGGTSIASNYYVPINADGYQYVALNSTKDKPAGTNISMLAVISDRFVTGKKAPGYVVLTMGSVSGDGRNFIAFVFCFEPGTFADANEARQWFTDNPTNVWFAGMPETEQLDTVQLPQLPAPTFNVYHDSQVPSDTSVEYERDVNIAYEQLEAKIAALTVAQATS